MLIHKIYVYVYIYTEIYYIYTYVVGREERTGNKERILVDMAGERGRRIESCCGAWSKESRGHDNVQLCGCGRPCGCGTA